MEKQGEDSSYGMVEKPKARYSSTRMSTKTVYVA